MAMPGPVAFATVAVDPSARYLPSQLKRQKGQFEDNIYSLHNIPSPSPSLERSPVYLTCPSSAHRSSSLSNWLVPQPMSRLDRCLLPK